MAKFKRSIQPAGFRPEQVSERNVSQLQAYSDRLTNALRQERDAVVSNRNEIANSMQTNAKIEAEQASVNKNVQQQNLDTKLKEQQDLSARALEEYDNKTKVSKELFTTVSDLSLTAAKKLRKIELERLKEQDKATAAEIMIMGDNHPAVKALRAIKTEVNVEELTSKVQLAQARAQGADDIDVDQAISQLNELGYQSKSALLKYIGGKWGGHLTTAMSDKTKKYTNPETGEQFSGLDAMGNRQLAQIVAAEEYANFEAINGISGQLAALKQETGYLDSIFNVTQNAVNTAGRKQHENFIQDELSNISFKLAQAGDNPEETRTIIETNFPTVQSLVGNKAAQEWMQQIAQQSDSDGRPVYNTAGIFSARLGPKGETWGEYWEPRKEEAEKALGSAFTTAYRQQENIKDINIERSYTESFHSGLLQQLAAGSAQDDLSILATAKTELLKKYDGALPRKFVELERRILAEGKEESQRRYDIITEKIRVGTSTRGEVLSIADPELRSKALEAHTQATKVRKYGENYEATFKKIDTAAKQVMGDSLEGSASFEAFRLGLVMKKHFAEDYETALNETNDPAAALRIASDRLEKEKNAAILNEDKNARYHSTSGPNNEKVFTHIENFKVNTAAQKEQSMDTLIATIGALGVGALDSPGLLATDAQLRKLSEANRAGEVLVFTPQTNKAVELLKTDGERVTHLEAINAAIKARNKVNADQIPQLILDPALQAFNNSRPETQKLFIDNPTPTTVMRGAAEIAQTPLRDPSNIRANIVQYVTGQPSMRSVVRGADGRAVIYDPVGHGGRDYHNHYQFSSVPERERVETILRNTIDPWTGQPYNITSTTKGLDGKTPRKGTHGLGLSMDVAPPETLPPDQEEAWSAHLNKVLGYDPLRAN